MNLIFWGLLPLLIDFFLNFGNCSVSVLPAFVGCILILVGMARVPECALWQRARSLAVTAAVFTAAVWLLNALGLGALENGVVSMALALVSDVFQMVMTWKVYKGIAELAETNSWDLYGRSLRTAWQVLLVWVALAQITAWLGIALLALLAEIMVIAFSLYYLFRFHKSRRAYEEYVACREED